MDHITDEQVMATLREVVAERPDYVYEAPAHMEGAKDGSCFYVHTDDGDQTPGCIVGHVLYRLGAPLEDLLNHENTSAVEAAPAFGVSDEAAHVLNYAQASQDIGESWSTALANAEQHFAEVSA